MSATKWIDTLKQIRQGVSNHLSEDTPELQEMIDSRMKWCVGDPEQGIPTCEHFSHSNINAAAEGVLDFVRKLNGLPEDQLKSFEGKQCSVCGCSFRLYLKSEDKQCPKGKW